MALNPELLRSSLELVIERQPAVTKRFYELLFERHPELKPMFNMDRLDTQAKMLAEAIVAVVDHLEDASWLQEHLGALGAKHVEYGVTPPMYGKVGETLLAALAEAAGDDWSPAIEAAWADAYGAICELMLAGARESESEVASQ